MILHLMNITFPDESLPKREAMVTSKQLPKFRRIVMPPSSGLNLYVPTAVTVGPED